MLDKRIPTSDSGRRDMAEHAQPQGTESSNMGLMDNTVPGSGPDRPRGRLSNILAGIILAHGTINITLNLLRGAKPEWLAAAWISIFILWALLCLRSLPAAYLLLVFFLPFFGARPGDLVTNLQDTFILAAAAVSLFRYPLRLMRLPLLLQGWVLVVVAFVSLLANASLCFYPLWPLHQDNLTQNLFFMFSESWDWTFGISQWWMLVLMLLLARSLIHMLRDHLLTPGRIVFALGAGLFVTLLVGFAEYYHQPFHDLLVQYQLRLYDHWHEEKAHWNVPDFLRCPFDLNVTMKSLFANRGWLGMYLLAATPPVCGALAAGKRSWVRWMSLPVALAAVLAIVLTGARASLYATGLGLLLLAVVLIARRLPFRNVFQQKTATALVLAAMAITVAVPCFIWSKSSEPTQTSSWTNPTFRDAAWQKALVLIKQRPAVGVGYESFGLAARDVPPADPYPFIDTHNFCTQILVCIGPAGAICLLLLFALPVRLLLLFMADEEPVPAQPVAVGFALAFMLIFINGQAQHWWYLRSTALFWWLGMAVIKYALDVRTDETTSRTGTGLSPLEPGGELEA